jgi:hypothetical protein
MRETPARLALGWLRFHAIMLLPIRLENRLWCWALSWAGWYATLPFQLQGTDLGGRKAFDAENAKPLASNGPDET